MIGDTSIRVTLVEEKERKSCQIHNDISYLKLVTNNKKENTSLQMPKMQKRCKRDAKVESTYVD
jgi:hypothetical protein